MVAPIPKKVSDVVQDEINEIIGGLPRYLPDDDPRIMDWRDRLDSGLNNPSTRAEVMLALAVVAHITGDIALADKYFNKALTFGSDAGAVFTQRHASYLNLGFALEAQEYGRRAFEIYKKSRITPLATIAGSGDFEFLSEVLAFLDDIKYDATQLPQYAQLKTIADSYKKLGHSPIDYGKVLDIAGSILRKNRLFWLEQEARFSFDNEMECIGIRYNLDVSTDVALEFTAEFVEQVIALNLDQIPLSIRFIGIAKEAMTGVQ